MIDAIKEQTLYTFNDCAQNCKAQCIDFMKSTALNSGMWILYLAFIFFIIYANVRNEKIIGKAIASTGMTREKIMSVSEWFYVFGVIAMAIYIIQFLISGWFFSLK